MALFEKAVLLWNTPLWRRKQREENRPPISMFQQLEMSKERFLREFQERSKGYTNRNGRNCWFDDSVLMKTALVKIYQHSFQNQEYIEIINATSSAIYPEIFHETFSSNLDLRNFSVIGIIGEQSGGKSFLVNKVFGTKIAESKFKCTTGILATRVNVTGHENVKNTVILDTEGLLDRSKKNAEAQIFDRKIVLEVMARSHVVLINITRNINKTMQQILEIVLYGLNKLHIINKPKMIFLFRDQDPRTMGEAEQRDHAGEVMDDIKHACEQINCDVQNIIDGFDIHEFPSPFVDFLVGDREISFFSDSFCQKALSLRLKIIDQLASLRPFDSFNEWIALTLDLWQQISYNSNLFDYVSLVHLTLEKALEAFCNRVLTEANSEMRTMISDILDTEARIRSDDNIILHEIKRKLADKKRSLADNLLSHQLTNEKKYLMRKHNLESFPEALWDNTKSRIESSLNLYETDHCMAATRQFQQDDFQKKLSEIPKHLSLKIREIQCVSENTAQFETLYIDTSTALLTELVQMLENDYREQSIGLKHQLIQNFVEQNRIDNVGVSYFHKHINDPSLIEIVRKAVLGEDSRSKGDCLLDPVPNILVPHQATQLALAIPHLVTTSQHGCGIFRAHASHIYDRFFHKRKNNNNKEEQFEKMLSLLKIGYTALQNNSYYDNNLLPIPELANDSVRHIGEAIKTNNVTDQEIRNMWYTCYGIMLNIFCDEHCNYINKKLVTEFEQEISRTKEEVKQNIANASTAEEHGQALIKQIWTMIRNDVQKQLQNEFIRFFATWNDYYPSIISENCVNQLFRSIDYQKMFNYIQDPMTYIKEWLRSQFSEKYQIQLNQTILNLSLHLNDKKMKFSRMILVWYSAIQASHSQRSVTELIKSLKEFLINGEYKKDNISLTDPTGGFPILDSTTVRTIPATADKHHLLLAILSASKTMPADNDDCVKESTKNLINNEQLKNRLFDRFYNRARGCGTPCPYCKQMCDNDNPLHTAHLCENHLLWVFGGYRHKDTEKPGLICCTSNTAFTMEVQRLTDHHKYLPFPEHIRRYNPTWKIINRRTELENFQLKSYIALEEDFSEYYNFKGRADIEIRRRFLRSTITAHCYALLVGIDYENTSYSLGGIPSNDVSCIKEQLEDSSMAFSENLHVLTNTQATKENILCILDTIVNNMDERSTFIFYFSGHGGRTRSKTSYLLTVDNQPLTAVELAASVGKAKTNKIILMLDSCYSGGMGNAFCFDAHNYKQGIHILCSSRDTEVSSQDTNGFFTRHLIKGLKGEFACRKGNCNECATRTENLQRALIRKVRSTELILYLDHAITGRQNFTHTAVNGSSFDISFIN